MAWLKVTNNQSKQKTHFKSVFKVDFSVIETFFKNEHFPVKASFEMRI